MSDKLNGQDKYTEIIKQLEKEKTQKGKQDLIGMMICMLTKDVRQIFIKMHRLDKKFYIAMAVIFFAIVLGQSLDLSQWIHLIGMVF